MRKSTQKLISLLLGAIVASSPYFILSDANAANPKVGSACKKAGLIQTSNAVVFICKKSGKKLVWTITLGVKKTPFPTP